MNSYIESDVSSILNVQNKMKFIEFLSIIASLTGQELVYDTISKSIGVSINTVKTWVGIFVSCNIVHLLRPFHDSLMIKRIVKHPKVYFTDTGFACYLMGIHNPEVLSKGIYKGRLVETYIVNEIMKSYRNNCRGCDFFFYRDNNGNEIDIIMLRDATISMIECKSGFFDKHDVKYYLK